MADSGRLTPRASNVTHAARPRVVIHAINGLSSKLSVAQQAVFNPFAAVSQGPGICTIHVPTQR